MKKIAVAAALAGGVVLSAPALAGEAEDIARAESVMATLEAAKAAQTRAHQRAIAALSAIESCEGCKSALEIAAKSDKAERALLIQPAYKVLYEEFLKEEAGR